MRKINLDPQKRPQSVLTIFGGALSERDANKVSSENGHTAPQNGNENNAPPVASPVSHSKVYFSQEGPKIKWVLPFEPLACF